MKRQQLLSRISNPTLRSAAAQALDTAERFAARAASISADARFTAQGRNEALTAELQRDFGPALRLARQPLQDARAALDARKAKITLPALDPADVAGQLRGMERRAAIAALDPAERSRLLFDNETDRRLVDAVLAEPPQLSGLAPERHAELMNMRLRQLHGAELDALERDEKALAEAEAAVAVASNDMKAAFDPQADGVQFDRIMNAAPVPWLVDLGGGSIACVKLDEQGRATYPQASEVEKRTGRFFKDLQEYRAQAAA